MGQGQRKGGVVLIGITGANSLLGKLICRADILDFRLLCIDIRENIPSQRLTTPHCHRMKVPMCVAIFRSQVIFVISVNVVFDRSKNAQMFGCYHVFGSIQIIFCGNTVQVYPFSVHIGRNILVQTFFIEGACAIVHGNADAVLRQNDLIAVSIHQLQLKELHHRCGVNIHILQSLRPIKCAFIHRCRHQCCAIQQITVIGRNGNHYIQIGQSIIIALIYIIECFSIRRTGFYIALRCTVVVDLQFKGHGQHGHVVIQAGHFLAVGEGVDILLFQQLKFQSVDSGSAGAEFALLYKPLTDF